MSCTDFLTIYPQDRVVEDNFWEDKNDLEGVRYGAYMQMSNTISNFIIWGDIRSDAYHCNFDYTGINDTEIKRLLEADPDTTSSYYDWGGVYTTINYCNKVLAHGDEVLEKDPQFTPTEWQQMKAEMTGLRALNYFYLLRAFKDIPFTTEVINSDEDVHDFTLTTQLEVLDWLINDVTAVAGQAKSRFPTDRDTKGLMTNTSIYALLAEMHLWRSALREGRGYPEDQVIEDAQKTIEYGQKSLDALASQNSQIDNSSFDRGSAKKEDFGSGLKNALLIRNESMQNDYNANDDNITVSSFKNIFVNGNSEESMFELQFSAADQRNSGFLRNYWGYNENKSFYLVVSDDAVNAAINNSEKKKNDCRIWYSCTPATQLYSATKTRNTQARYYYLTKWLEPSFDRSKDNILCTNIIFRPSTSYQNWIFYRMTDVMLMMAEAYAITGEYEKCRKIVDAIHKRSMLDQTTVLSNNESTKDKCIELVMRERLIEFLGEGKRWFDLVRYAERKAGGAADGQDSGDVDPEADPRETQVKNGKLGMKSMVKDFLAKGYYSQLAENLISRMQNRYGMYCPIYYRERSANHYLIPQNPAWDREKINNIPK